MRVDSGFKALVMMWFAIDSKRNMHATRESLPAMDFCFRRTRIPCKLLESYGTQGSP